MNDSNSLSSVSFPEGTFGANPPRVAQGCPWIPVPPPPTSRSLPPQLAFREVPRLGKPWETGPSPMAALSLTLHVWPDTSVPVPSLETLSTTLFQRQPAKGCSLAITVPPKLAPSNQPSSLALSPTPTLLSRPAVCTLPVPTSLHMLTRSPGAPFIVPQSPPPRDFVSSLVAPVLPDWSSRTQGSVPHYPLGAVLRLLHRKL